MMADERKNYYAKMKRSISLFKLTSNALPVDRITAWLPQTYGRVEWLSIIILFMCRMIKGCLMQFLLEKNIKLTKQTNLENGTKCKAEEILFDKAVQFHCIQLFIPTPSTQLTLLEKSKGETTTHMQQVFPRRGNE